MNTAALSTQRLWAYLQLIRPANIVTAWADVLAGFAVTSDADFSSLAWLLLATTGLYGGGIVFNDVFDAEIDAKERPERPIPSGRASLSIAVLLGSILLCLGIIAASVVSWLSGVLAFSIACAAIFYNGKSKHHSILGPLNMGVCRGANLLLGVSVAPLILEQYWFLALIPIVYIAAITTLSRGEVHGADNSTAAIALILMSSVIIGLLGLGLLKDYDQLAAIPLIIILGIRVLIPFVKTVQQPTPEKIRIAVRCGVLSLIVLDATLAAGFANLTYGVVVLSLLLISTILARVFAVT